LTRIGAIGRIRINVVVNVYPCPSKFKNPFMLFFFTLSTYYHKLKSIYAIMKSDHHNFQNLMKMKVARQS
jgi:hypothetical protein